MPSISPKGKAPPRRSRGRPDAAAAQRELRRIDRETPVRETVRPVQDRGTARPTTAPAADKAFRDSLNGDP